MSEVKLVQNNLLKTLITGKKGVSVMLQDNDVIQTDKEEIGKIRELF